MRESTLDTLRDARVVPVIDLADPAGARPLAEALLAGGARIAEMTLRSPRSVEALEAMSKATRDLGVGPDGHPLLIAAGTVLTPEEFDRARESGADLLVSPGMTTRLCAHARAGDADWIPGASTAGEVMEAIDNGFTVVKFFPAEASGGLPALRALLAPLKRTGVTIMPTGGITAKTAADYLTIDGVAAVGGSWMVTPQLLVEQNWPEVSRLMREAVSA